MDIEFADKVSALVSKHPRYYYSDEIERNEFRRNIARSDLVHDVFCTIWEEYEVAMLASIQKISRYERSLKAWIKVIGEADDEVRDTLIADYVEPVFRAACDLPGTFQDQAKKAIYKLKVAFDDESSLCTLSGCGGSTRITHDMYLKKCADDQEVQALKTVLLDELFDSDDAKCLRELHGCLIHDSHESLISGRNAVVFPQPGVAVFVSSFPLDVKTYIEVIDRQRQSMLKAYDLFYEYALCLYSRFQDMEQNVSRCVARDDQSFLRR